MSKKNYRKKEEERIIRLRRTMKVRCFKCNQIFEELHSPGICHSCRDKELRINQIVRRLWELEIPTINSILDSMKPPPEAVKIEWELPEPVEPELPPALKVMVNLMHKLVY